MIRLPIGRTLGLSVLPEDSSTGGQEKLGIKQWTTSLLNHSRPIVKVSALNVIHPLQQALN